MKVVLSNQKYNTRLEASDWRYSASIVGLVKYFHYFNIPYSGYENDVDFIEYNQQDLREDLYLQFVENYFEKDMHHRVVEDMLKQEQLSDEQIQLVNEKLSANVPMKKVFSNLKYSDENKDEILNRIQAHREELIKDTYKNKKNLYAKFLNTGCLFKGRQKVCRLHGYYVDSGRKTKSISYNFNADTFIYADEIEFDFIPFAFSQSYEALFVNNNYTIRQLVETNQKIQTLSKTGSLFTQIKESSDFIYFDVEVIKKSQELDYFESLYIRKHSIDIIRKIDRYSLIQFKYKINDKLFIHVEQEVVEHILNNLVLDDLIELLLKESFNDHLRINQLIKINATLGGMNMDKNMKSAYACAKQVAANIPANKVNSYKQKLISAIVAHDYKRVCEILLQLSSYSGVVFNFAYDLFEDFEQHKNIAYTFINALNTQKNEVGEHGNEKK